MLSPLPHPLARLGARWSPPHRHRVDVGKGDTAVRRCARRTALEALAGGQQDVLQDFVGEHLGAGGSESRRTGDGPDKDRFSEG